MVFAFDVRANKLIAQLVETKEDGSCFRTSQWLNAFRILKALPALNRNSVGHVDVAGDQSSNAGRVI